MQKYRWLTISVALALAVVMLWAAPTLAQGYGKGMRGQGGPGWGCGQGQVQGQDLASNTCPNYPDYQRGQAPWCNPQAGGGGRGPRGGGRMYQRNNTQTPVTPPTQ